MPELVVQLASLIALAVWLVLPRSGTQEKSKDWLLWGCVAAFAAVPIVQLIPLPPSIWQSLPGREVELAALRLVGAGDTWRPITLAPWMTAASMLSLIPPITMIFFVSNLPLKERVDLLACLAGLVILSAIVGVIQLSSGNANWLRFYTYTHYGFATGFQANRNATADVLLIGILALGAFASIRRDLFKSAIARALYVGITLFLLLSVILTGSRAGTSLLVVAGLSLLTIFRPRVTIARRTALAIVAICVVTLGTVAALRDNSRLQQTWDRFAQKSDARPELWADTRYVIGQYWPVGSGIGTFVPVFIAAEPLEAVDTSWPNRAHEDYLEYTLEAGLAGIVVLLACAISLAGRILSTIRSPQDSSGLTLSWFALGALLILALHSLVDYPIRCMSLAGIAGLAIGILGKSSDRSRTTSVNSRQRTDGIHQGVFGR
ncbi:hypothetical protein GCM10009087_26480 [Sphingomonas oligophenolica]|uniref:O-antigen ligase family protein n=1 Tax=Sphingomonas oligophenolica TaxID=301154 RepID=A0ABU9YCT2_9SPHN